MSVYTWLNQILADEVTAECQQLATQQTLADSLRAKAFGITPENVGEVIFERSHLLRSVYPSFCQLCRHLHLEPLQLLNTLWDLWLPLAIQLASWRKQQSRVLIQGILGGQGTGKTTLGAILTLILAQLGYQSLSLSLDDLYKTYEQRLALLSKDSRLVWRGPPGTHDIELGLTVLDHLRQSNFPVEVPRFDKSAYGGAGDRQASEIISSADIVLFEGWFVGVRPINPEAFETAPPPILTTSDRSFARDINANLQAYLPLWQRLDRLMVFYPVDYRFSLEWRMQAEHQMIATGRPGMSDAEVEEFVKYFWRSLHPDLFIKPLTKDPNLVDLVIEINSDHSISSVYRPQDVIAVLRKVRTTSTFEN